MSSSIQNFYKQTITRNWTATTGDFNVSTKPTVTSGYLVLSPNNANLREIVRYSAVGTNAYGDFVTISNLTDRGLGGTTAQVHTIGESIRMNITAEYWQEMIDDIDSIIASGLPTGVLGDVIYNNGTNWIPSNLDSLLDTYTEGKVKTAIVSLSSADILALHTTPITLVPAPGAGKISILDEVVYSFTYIAPTYAGGNNFNIFYDGDSEYLVNVADTGLTNTAFNTIRSYYPKADGNTDYVILDDGINKSIKLSSNLALTTGKGTLKVFVKYRILTL